MSLLIDEAHNVLTPSVAKMLAEGRSAGLEAVFAWQYSAQIRDEVIRSGVRSLLQSLSIFRMREMDDARSLAGLAMEVYSDHISVDQEEQERLRFSPDDIVKLPTQNAMTSSDLVTSRSYADAHRYDGAAIHHDRVPVAVPCATQPRDVAIIRDVWRYKFLSAPQILELWWPGKTERAAQRRLSNAALLEWEGETDIDPPTTAKHGQLRLTGDWSAKGLHDRHARLVRPDAVLEVIDTDDIIRTFLIEYDRTRRVDKNFTKFRRYDAFLNWWWQHTPYADNDQPPYILFVCQDAQQREQFMAAADRELNGHRWHPSLDPDDYQYVGRTACSPSNTTPTAACSTPGGYPPTRATTARAPATCGESNCPQPTSRQSTASTKPPKPSTRRRCVRSCRSKLATTRNVATPPVTLAPSVAGASSEPAPAHPLQLQSRWML